MNLASLLRLLGAHSPLGALLCPALPAVASRCSFLLFSTNRGSLEDITRLNELMPAIFGCFCGIPPAQCAVVGRGCPRFAPLPVLTTGRRRSGATHMRPCSSPPAVFAAATPLGVPHYPPDPRPIPPHSAALDRSHAPSWNPALRAQVP
ncbi:hypothetical protein B0H14DRAFT_3010516 [Mycena olivaceomarginata]|nr:hypothetical protein B0H14DRAFT_3010516 [Mycena olivaceomarginata]